MEPPQNIFFPWECHSTLGLKIKTRTTRGLLFLLSCGTAENLPCGRGPDVPIPCLSCSHTCDDLVVLRRCLPEVVSLNTQRASALAHPSLNTQECCPLLATCTLLSFGFEWEANGFTVSRRPQCETDLRYFRSESRTLRRGRDLPDCGPPSIQAARMLTNSGCSCNDFHFRVRLCTGSGLCV